MSTKLTAFTRPNLADVRARLEAALAPLAAELGISVKVLGASFMSNSATFKVELATLGEGGVANTRAAEEFKMFASMHGLKADDLGRSFNASGRTFIITGYSSRARARPIIATSGGKEFAFAADGVVRALAAMGGK